MLLTMLLLLPQIASLQGRPEPALCIPAEFPSLHRKTGTRPFHDRLACRGETDPGRLTPHRLASDSHDPHRAADTTPWAADCRLPRPEPTRQPPRPNPCPHPSPLAPSPGQGVRSPSPGQWPRSDRRAQRSRRRALLPVRRGGCPRVPRPEAKDVRRARVGRRNLARRDEATLTVCTLGLPPPQHCLQGKRSAYKHGARGVQSAAHVCAPKWHVRRTFVRTS